MHDVHYTREQHAAHYAHGHPAVGHDLERWTYAQPERLPVPAEIPADAEYHSGHRESDVQYWTYARRAPLSGPPCVWCLARRAS